MLDVAAALKAKGLSHRRAGEEVLAGWKRRERLPSYPTPAAIGVKIGLLKKGDRTWWLNHEKALQALADVLRCKPADLLSVDEAATSLIEFPDFPEMAGLLPGQDPCAVNPDGWLGTRVEVALRQAERSWFLASPGSGKTLAVSVLRRRHGSKLVASTVRTLADAAREAKVGTPLLVEVEHRDPVTDLPAMVELSKHADAVCVLAPFTRPAAVDVDWIDQRWDLEEGWDEHLLRWVQTRLPANRRLDPRDILDWLDVIDLERNVFATPGDLMPLVARASRAGLPKRQEGLSGFARDWLTRTCAGDSEPWLRRVGREVIEHVVADRLRRLDLPATPMTVLELAELVPASVFAATPAKGRAAKKAPTEQSTLGPVEVVNALSDRGLLQTFESGIDTFPRWVRDGIERETIVDAVKTGDTAWPSWAVNTSRRGPVDAALDSLPPHDLIKAIRRVGADDDLLGVAAVEALFSAIGRRLLNTEWQPASEMIPTLQDLGERQLRLLVDNPLLAPAPFTPLTRYRPDDNAWQASWLAEAWAFSFAIPRPKKGVRSGWGLPGWAENLRLANAPSFPFHFGSERVREQLLRVGREVLRVVRDASLPDNVDLLFLPWATIDGPEHGWTIPDRLAHALAEQLTTIGQLLRSEPAEIQTRTTTTVWPLLLSRFGGPLKALRFMHQSHRPFFDIVGEHLPLAVLEDAIESMDAMRADDLSVLVALPERLRRSALHAVARLTTSTDHPIWRLDEIVSTLDTDDIELLVEFAGERYSVGRAATERVWSLDADRALVEAVKSLSKKADSAAWFFTAPREHFDALLDALGSLKHSPPWATRWLAAILSSAGTQAPRVFEMLGRERASPS